MLKKFIAIAMLAIFALSLTGCMQITYHVTLNSDGTANAEYEMYMDKSSVSMIMGNEGEAADPFAENKAQAEANGYTVTPLETESQVGFKATAENTELNIQDIVSNVGMGGNGNGGITVEKGLFTNKYTVMANIDTTKIFGEDEQSQSVIPMLASAIDAKLVFTAPSEITSATGTKSATIPNTYEYKIELGKDNLISFSYTMLNMTNIYICIGIVLIALLFVVFFIRSKMKKGKSENEIIIGEDEEAGTEVSPEEVIEEPVEEVAEESIEEVAEEAEIEEVPEQTEE